MYEDRGRLLFRANGLWRGLGICAGWIALAFLWIFDSGRHGWETMDMIIGVINLIYGGISVFSLVRSVRGVAFYEKGIFFPQEISGARARFIYWSAVERTHWDGDVLTVVPSTSVLSTGGGPRLSGGSVKVPRNRRAEVEQLLAAIPRAA